MGICSIRSVCLPITSLRCVNKALTCQRGRTMDSFAFTSQSGIVRGSVAASEWDEVGAPPLETVRGVMASSHGLTVLRRRRMKMWVVCSDEMFCLSAVC